ncbi:hypothetical protein DNU06_06580 [Putridiphycobacter roseus]|uniref:DUF5723 domain-containing protein n=1 Tax=Putridiphycobacter roseus TaxID=2219161 RepID=A0A2W1MZ53_9FLAO|nr:DUF5723 family protein [Putridiphycobacter roseus]PZE17489.1 hypothetical protein DNU06_06580 [Putridiphycobacter roseus]
MKNICITLILFLIVNAGFTQQLDMVYIDSISSNRLLQVNSNNNFSTTSLKNDFTSKFINGGNISAEIIKNNPQKLFNALGAEITQSINYYEGSFLKENKNLGLTFSISDHHFVSGNYKPKLFDLLFEGNTSTLGDTLDFSYTHLQYLHYQNYSIGLYDKRTFSYIKLGFIVGNRSINLRSGETYFYTSPAQDAMYFETSSSFVNTYNDSSTNYLTANGYGFSLELNHNFMIKTKNEKRHIINFNLGNIGTIFWNNKTNTSYLDSSITFDGIAYNNVDYYSQLSTDEIADSLGVYKSTGSIRESLPIQIMIHKIPVYSLTQKWQSTFGFKSILIPDYRPLVYAGVYYQPNALLSFSTKLIFGGYGSLRMALNANLYLNDKLFIGLNTQDIIGTTSNQYGSGKSINFSLSLKL